MDNTFSNINLDRISKKEESIVNFITGKNEELFKDLLDTLDLEEGIDYERQFVFDDTFVVDFVFHTIKLFVEIDGIGHKYGKQPEKDLEREFLASCKGWSVLRIDEKKLLKNATFYKYLIKELLNK